MRSTLSLAALGVSAALVAGCGSAVTPQTQATDAGQAVTITNCGRDVTVPGAPKAAVGLSPSQTELLLRLGLADALVGQAQTATAPLSDDVAGLAAAVPVLSESGPPSREQLLNARPDFVFSPTMYEFTAEQGFASLDQLQQAGVTAYVATGGCADRRMSGTVEDVFTDLENLGKVFAAPDRAAPLIEKGKADLAAVDTAVASRAKPTVAQVYLEGATVTAIGAGIEYDIIRRAGGDNVFSPRDPQFAKFFAAQITPEALAAANPDAIVFAVNGSEHEQATVDFLNRTFPDMTAVRERRLIAIDAADTYPGTLGNVSVVREIAERLHPDAFTP
ncbi:zinc ABC transporter substrate-binding protein [Saccharothrix sp. NRRL B-16348]|uniref:ABC transporter substrate-binding protein n=1 Tax=Saccharothrix sp. NRRL B-16348 TaxID=1415542 RepID=UPI0006AF195C|nr:ABC transporter substrate-binding protein [Saccharothrix sp. NRRL B-16348]KOX20481.1 zinc ABC transporter substrate-binding protein [Saccharothrix sp. NRRL B-16348]